jgi:hypothetical protein
LTSSLIGIIVLEVEGAGIASLRSIPDRLIRMANEISKITLVALDEALASLDKANASDNMDSVRGHIGHAIIALDTALRDAEAVAYEVEERKKPPN